MKTPLSILFIVCSVASVLTGCDRKAAVSGTIPATRSSVYASAQKVVLKALKAPATAKFPSSSEEGVGMRHLGNDIWRVDGYVDAQNAFSALIRSTWTVYLYTDASGAFQGKYLQLGKEEFGDEKAIVAYAEGFDSVYGFKLRDGIQVQGEDLERQRAEFVAKRNAELAAKEAAEAAWRAKYAEERAAAEKEEEAARIAKEAVWAAFTAQAKKDQIQRTAERRSRLHGAAQKQVVEWLASKTQPRHSTLGERDDKWTVCRELGEGVWEARGVMQIAESRANWHILFATNDYDTVFPLYIKAGEKPSSANLSAVLQAARLPANAATE